MKKTISFEKKIEFPSMIGEITSISLDHTLKFIDTYNIEGEFLVNGTYKLTEASRIEESFDYKLPTEIIISEKLDQDSIKITIDDFYYEIENDYTLICYIDIKIEGLEIIELEEEKEAVEEIKHVESKIEENKTEDNTIDSLEEHFIKIETIEQEEELTRECDGDEIKEEMEKEYQMETKEPAVSSLFENINEGEETYSTYSVYILREEETISSLIEKYKTTKEELESYNDLNNLSIGTKIIIPLHDE